MAMAQQRDGNGAKSHQREEFIKFTPPPASSNERNLRGGEWNHAAQAISRVSTAISCHPFITAKFQRLREGLNAVYLTHIPMAAYR